MDGLECEQIAVTEAIAAACSTDYTQIKHAEQIIGQLEQKAKFHPILAVSIPFVNVQWYLSVININIYNLK